jgi:hypothetical protein
MNMETSNDEAGVECIYNTFNILSYTPGIVEKRERKKAIAETKRTGLPHSIIVIKV